MIELGLERLEALSRLISRPLPWKAFHIAGTNGKGTVAAYLSAFLHAQGHRTGRFTSPHLIDRWDCIAIDGTPVGRDLFRMTEDSMIRQAKAKRVQPSEFELLTATAFDIFSCEKVRYAMVECGMGGRLDATNIFSPDELAVSIITKIDLDHQSFLGQTLEEIAAHKAGIMRRGVPCITFQREDEKVRDVLVHHAHAIGAPHFSTGHELLKDTYNQIQKACEELAIRDPQGENVALAYLALKLGSETFPNSDLPYLKSVVSRVSWPGRLQNIDLTPWVQSPFPVLLDGAHNPASAIALRNHLEHKLLQNPTDPVIWVLAFSSGKDIKRLLQILIRPQDKIYFTSFGPVDGMPWVKPEPVWKLLGTLSELRLEARNVDENSYMPSTETSSEQNLAKDLSPEDQDHLAHDRPPDLGREQYERILRLRKAASKMQKACVEHAVFNAERSPIVIAGSLYLVGDILRSLRQDTATSDPGLS